MTRPRRLLWTRTGVPALLLAAGCVALSGCATTSQGPTVQLDADVDDRLGGTGPESGDVRGASEQVARAITGACAQGLVDSVHPRIALMPVRNLSRFRVDPQLLRNRLTHDLVAHARGRYDVVPIDDDTQAANAALTLKTEMRSLTKNNGEATSDYIQYACTLERPIDGTAVWSGIFETKRRSSVDVIYQ